MQHIVGEWFIAIMEITFQVHDVFLGKKQWPMQHGECLHVGGEWRWKSEVMAKIELVKNLSKDYQSCVSPFDS